MVIATILTCYVLTVLVGKRHRRLRFQSYVLVAAIVIVETALILLHMLKLPLPFDMPTY